MFETKIEKKMTGVIHFKRKAIFILCLPIITLLIFTLIYHHEHILDAPNLQRRILQTELRERMGVLDKATLDHFPIFSKIPKRIIIFTNDYSGYEHLEEILLTIPGVFIHKPLECNTQTDDCDDRDWSIVSPEYREILGNETFTRKIFPLLHCKSTENREVIGSSVIVSTEVVEYCKRNQNTCLSEYFQQELCQMSSLQVLVLRNFDLYLALLIKNLKYSHIVYMIRDPRAVAMQQMEEQRGTCTNFTHCFDVIDLCRAMKNNMEGVQELVVRSSKNFKLLRLEELAYNLMHEMAQMFEDWGYKFTGETYNVMTELKPKIDNVAFEWDKDKQFKDIHEIQEKCLDVLEFYAFKIIESQKELELQVRTVNDLKSRLEVIRASGRGV